tara:strand:+ start:735 stop:1193 length:459 start_codon:yes stop_codon:yes gene_type:complete
MALKIRLSRGGSKKNPYYRIVVAESISPRDGKFVERIGSYNPMVDSNDSNKVILNVERIKYWLSKGAKPTLRVAKIMSKDGLVGKPEIREQPKKSSPKKKRLEREAEESKKNQTLEETKTESPAAEEMKTESPAAEETKTEKSSSEEAKKLK